MSCKSRRAVTKENSFHFISKMDSLLSITLDEDEDARAALREVEELQKLVLWYTRECKPLFSQTDLVPIMENLGFVPVYPPHSSTPPTRFGAVLINWMEYQYCGASAITTRTGAFRSKPLLAIQTPPSPKLPYPHIDGLHLFTYTAFLDALNFYLFTRCSDDIFHIQAIPANLDYQGLLGWSYADESRTLYQSGTLDQALKDRYSDDIADFMSLNAFPVTEDFLVDDDPEITMAPINDIIVNNIQDQQKGQDLEGAEDGEYGIHLGSESSPPTIWDI